MHRREQLAPRVFGDVLLGLFEDFAAEAAELGLVFVAEGVDGQPAGRLRVESGDLLEFAGEEIPSAFVLRPEFRRGLRFHFGGRLEPGRLAEGVLGGRLQFGGFERGLAAGQFDFGAQAGLVDGPDRVLPQLGHPIGGDGS